MTTKPENTTKPASVTESELWQLRALDAQSGRLQAEIKLMQQQGIEVQNQMETLLKTLSKKYGEDTRVAPDGKLIYTPTMPMPIPGVIGKPDVPLVPSIQPEEEEDEEEEA